MHVSFSVAVLCATAAGLALPVTGQTAGVTSSTFGVANKPTPAARLPYTAEFKITRVQMLASGATITHESTEVDVLDSQGRRMNSTTTIPLSGNQMQITRVSVLDPVARTNSSWAVPGKTATVIQMPAPGVSRTGCLTNMQVRLPDNRTQPERPKPVIEDLGTQTINGVEARGRRFTTTTPAGAIGNDAPLVRTSEAWTAIAPGLRGLMARDVTDDQQWGKMTKELTNFTQAEPDPSVFQPPEGYEIVNKPAPGSVCPGEEGIDPNMAPIPPPPPAQ
jgi:hypothetical protein